MAQVLALTGFLNVRSCMNVKVGQGYVWLTRSVEWNNHINY